MNCVVNELECFTKFTNTEKKTLLNRASCLLISIFALFYTHFTKHRYKLCNLRTSTRSDEKWAVISIRVRACLHGGGGGTQVGEVTRLDWVTRLSIQSLILIWSSLRVRWGDPPHVTSPIWDPPPPYKQALNKLIKINLLTFHLQFVKTKKGESLSSKSASSQ